MNEIQIPGMDPNVIETRNHTLFVEDVPDKFEPVEMAVQADGKQLPDIYERVQGGRLFKLHIGNFDAKASENHKMYDKLMSADPSDGIEIHISSDGGIFDELLEFYNVLKPKFEHIVTFLHRGYSAGSMMFLFGNDRVIYEHSDFMVHSYSGGAFGKREDMLNHAFHADKQLTKFFDKIYRPHFTKKELKKINNGKDFWMDAKEMLNRGIATHIITDEGKLLTAEEYLETSKPKKKGKK